MESRTLGWSGCCLWSVMLIFKEGDELRLLARWVPGTHIHWVPGTQTHTHTRSDTLTHTYADTHTHRHSLSLPLSLLWRSTLFTQSSLIPLKVDKRGQRQIFDIMLLIMPLFHPHIRTLNDNKHVLLSFARFDICIIMMLGLLIFTVRDRIDGKTQTVHWWLDLFNREQRKYISDTV